MTDPKPGMLDSHDDPHLGFDPDTDLAADGELSFDVPYEKRVDPPPLDPFDPEGGYRPPPPRIVRVSRMKTALSSGAALIVLAACCLSLTLFTLIALPPIDMNPPTPTRTFNETQRARLTEIAVTQGAPSNLTGTP